METVSKSKTKFGKKGPKKFKEIPPQDDGSESSDSNSEEDELGVHLTAQIEKNFLHTLACLKRDDPSLYDKDNRFFEESDKAASAPTEMATEEYAAWLQGNEAELPNKQEETKLNTLKEFWTNPELDDGEAFIRKYLLDKPYLADNHVPEEDMTEDLEKDEEQVEEMEDFEHRFNFRFEAPDKNLVEKYPRTLELMKRERDYKPKKMSAKKRARVEALRSMKLERMNEETTSESNNSEVKKKAKKAKKAKRRRESEANEEVLDNE